MIQSINKIFPRLLSIPIYNSFSVLTQKDYDSLKSAFDKNRDMLIFHELIRESNNVVDNINYFKIYKILSESQAEIKHYEDFFHQINSLVKKKSDNIRMLLAKTKVHMAKQMEKNNELSAAISQLDQSLEVLEDSLVPPVLLYYQIYRYYGHVTHQMGDFEKAVEILKQSTEMIDSYLQHSEDQLTNNENCRRQAKAFNTLAELDPKERKKWVEKAKESWEFFDGDKYVEEDYANTVSWLVRQEYQQSKEKGEEMLMFNLYQFKQDGLKDKLKKVREEFQGN